MAAHREEREGEEPRGRRGVRDGGDHGEDLRRGPRNGGRRALQLPGVVQQSVSANALTPNVHVRSSFLQGSSDRSHGNRGC